MALSTGKQNLGFKILFCGNLMYNVSSSEQDRSYLSVVVNNLFWKLE